jgi:hypothetical protein
MRKNDEELMVSCFEPAVIKIMSKALELCCAAADEQQDDVQDDVKDRMARIIIELAMDGERDMTKLCRTAVNAVFYPN